MSSENKIPVPHGQKARCDQKFVENSTTTVTERKTINVVVLTTLTLETNARKSYCPSGSDYKNLPIRQLIEGGKI